VFFKFNLLLIVISFLAVSNNITAHQAKKKKEIVLRYGKRAGGSLHLKSQFRRGSDGGHHGHHRKGRHHSGRKIFEPVILKLKAEIRQQIQRQQRKRHGHGHGHGRKGSFDLRKADLISVKIVAKSKHGGGTVSLLVGDQLTTPSPIQGWSGRFDKRRARTFYDIYLDNPNWNSEGRWQLFFKGNIKIRKIILTIEVPQNHEHGGHGRGRDRRHGGRDRDRHGGGHGIGRNRPSIPTHRLDRPGLDRPVVIVRPANNWTPLTRVQVVYGCNNYRVPTNRQVSDMQITFLSGNASLTNIQFELRNGSRIPYNSLNSSSLFGAHSSDTTYWVKDILFDSCYYQSGISPLLEIKTSSR